MDDLLKEAINTKLREAVEQDIPETEFNQLKRKVEAITALSQEMEE